MSLTSTCHFEILWFSLNTSVTLFFVHSSGKPVLLPVLILSQPCRMSGCSLSEKVPGHPSQGNKAGALWKRQWFRDRHGSVPGTWCPRQPQTGTASHQDTRRFHRVPLSHQRDPKSPVPTWVNKWFQYQAPAVWKKEKDGMLRRNEMDQQEIYILTMFQEDSFFLIENETGT